MNYNKIAFAIIAILMFFGRILAQDDVGVVYHPSDSERTKSVKKELKVGDTLPDYVFAHPLVNYREGPVRISDFRGKLLILEFWSLGCVTCITGFPKLQELQEQFDDQIQILLVNPWSDRQQVLDLLERRRKLTGFEMKLPIAFGDTGLSEYFPMTGVPHVVWIDENGVIASITGGSELNADNVNRVIAGDIKGIPQAVTYQIERDYEKPLFVDGNGGDGESLLWHSLLAREDLRLQPTVSVRNNKIILQNSPLSFIYRVAYGYANHPFNFGRAVRLHPSRIVFDLPVNELPILDNAYIYELTSPEDRPQEELLGMLQQDLQRYFAWKARWETRRVECLVLTASDTTLLMGEKLREAPPVWHNRKELTVTIENATVPEFIFWLENFPFVTSTMPIVDETGYHGRMTGIRLEGIDERNWQDWNRHLKPYGLRFERGYRELEILVVTKD